MISHTNNNESNIMNVYKNDSVIVNSNLPHSSVQNCSQFNTLVNILKATDSESSGNINDEITDQIDISEEIPSRQILEEIIDHTCNNNGISLLDT